MQRWLEFWCQLETRLRQQAATDLELQRKRFEASLAEELGKQAKELKSAASSEQESKLLDVAAAHASKVANVEAAQELAKTEALSAALQKVFEVDVGISDLDRYLTMCLTFF